MHLTRCSIANADDHGATRNASLRSGRPELGLPAFAVTQEQAAQLSAFIRSFAASTETVEVSGTSDEVVLVGHSETGRAYFNGPVGRCASCHAVEDGKPSSASNLAHV